MVNCIQVLIGPTYRSDVWTVSVFKCALPTQGPFVVQLACNRSSKNELICVNSPQFPSHFAHIFCLIF